MNHTIFYSSTLHLYRVRIFALCVTVRILPYLRSKFVCVSICFWFKYLSDFVFYLLLSYKLFSSEIIQKVNAKEKHQLSFGNHDANGGEWERERGYEKREREKAKAK